MAADQDLVQRCLAGEVSAWGELYAQYHPPLCTAIKAILGRQSYDPNLVDEIAARVWYAIIADDGQRLGRYDPKRGGHLSTYLALIARNTVKEYFRAERRRRQREMAASLPEAGFGGPPSHALWLSPEDYLSSLEMGEFLATLTPSAQEFLAAFLLGSPLAGDGVRISRAGVRQRIHRLRAKLRTFLSGDE